MNPIVVFFQDLFANFAPFFILLGILIFVHELGHFLVAKFFGVRVETFSMGFGKKFLSFKRGDTTYCLSVIPLGGYVKMFGDDPTAHVPVEERSYAFLHKPLLQRFAIVVAGPLANLLFAIFVFSLIAGMGEDVAGPFVGDVAKDSKAYQVGFRSGDKILKLNDEETPTWSLAQKVIEANGGKTLAVTVQREGDAQPVQFSAPVEFGENENIFSSDRHVGQLSGLSQESHAAMIGISNSKTPAAAAGVQSLTLVTAVNGKKVSYWRDLAAAFAHVPGEAKSITIQTRDLSLPDKPENLRSFEIPFGPEWSHASDRVAALGFEPAELYIYQVQKRSPAAAAGMMAKDKVIRINGEAMTSWNDVLTKVKNYKLSDDGLEFTVLRGEKEQVLKIKPEMTTLMNPRKGNEEHRFTIGIVSGLIPIGAESVFFRLKDPGAILVQGLKDTKYFTEFVVMSMVRLVQGEVSAKNLGGVITIGRVASSSFAAGLSTFIRMMGFISVNLFLLNLLPIPILDGGHLLFYLIEGLRGAPLSMRKMEIAQQVGLMLLMFLMAFAFFNDITNLIASRW